MVVVQKAELKQISYQEYSDILDLLTSKLMAVLKQENKQIDLVVPILRSGGFTGLHIASKLGLTNILPVQYKYQYKSKISIEKKFDLPELIFELPKRPLILIVDSNTVDGAIAELVISDVKSKFPDAELWFASAVIDFSKGKFTNIDRVLFGLQSNESRKLTKNQADELNIPHSLIVFPWENLEEQWEEIARIFNAV